MEYKINLPVTSITPNKFGKTKFKLSDLKEAVTSSK